MELTFIVLITIIPYACAGFWYVAERKNLALLRSKIYASSWTREQAARELKNSLWTPIHGIVAYFFYRFVGYSGHTIFDFIYSFFFAYFWGDVFHYYSHVLFHRPAFSWVNHDEHHKSRVCSPFTAISFSFPEKLIFSVGIFGLPVILNQILPINFLGICTWYIFYLITNSFGHANFEIRSSAYIDKQSSFASTIYHAMHHARYVKNYGLAMRFFDKLHSTEWSDYERVYRQVKELQPLPRLTSKANSAASEEQEG